MQRLHLQHLRYKIIILPLDMQNYHFVPKCDFLDLIFKNYYKFVFTEILWQLIYLVI